MFTSSASFFLALMLGCLLLAGGNAHAGPASPLPFDLQQPDGVVFAARAVGDEFFGWYETVAGYPIHQDVASGEWRYLDPTARSLLPEHALALRADGPPPEGGPWTPEDTAAPPPEAEPGMAADMAAAEAEEDAPPSPSGVARLAVMCARFADMVAQPVTPPQVFYDKLFVKTLNAQTTLRDYYGKVSYGDFDVTGGPHGVMGWYTVSGTRASYAAPHATDPSIKDVNRAGFVREVVQMADAVMNFGAYDTNNDGYVECATVIAQGLPQDGSGGPNAFWSHQGKIPRYLTNDVNTEGEPVYVSRYFLVSELVRVPDDPSTTAVNEQHNEPQSIGVIAHEFGHALGLPDLYDRTDGTGSKASEGLGQWSLMAAGSWNSAGGIPGDCPAWPDAWCRKKLGWADVVNITTNTMNVRIPDVQTERTVYRLWTNGNFGPQYFLIENRYASGFDQGLPESTGGLLIYHVDDAVTTQNDNEWYYPASPSPRRTISGHYQVALEQADGLFNLDRTKSKKTGSASNQGDKEDVWTKGKTFNTDSVPSSRKYNTPPASGEGGPSYVQVRNINDPDLYDRSITADLIISSNEFAITTITLPAEPVDDVIPVYQTMPQFEGTAHDEDAWGTGVWEVQVYLREDKPDGRYWKFTTHEWQSSYSEQQQKGVAAGTGGRNWGRMMDDPALSDGVYEVKARSRDAAGLMGAFATAKFRIQRDMTAPDVIFGSLGGNPLTAVPTMTGSATDNVAIQSKQFALYSHTEKKWLKWTTGVLNSGTFSAADHAFPVNNGSTFWSVTLPVLLPNGDYQFFGEATDTTNQSSGWRFTYFTLQVSPKVTLTGPLHGSYRNSTPVITGTAQPGAGATLAFDRVTLTIQRGSQWWDGDSWENFLMELHVPVSGGIWSYPSSSSGAVALAPTGDGAYTVTVSTVDSLGRVSLPVLPGLSGNTTASFTLDTVPPALEITSPITTPSTVITGPPPLPLGSALIHGTADDSSGRPQVTLHLKRLADGKYWSGVNWFTDPDQADIPGSFGGEDLGSRTDWVCATRLPRLGIREGSLKNGTYEITAYARDAAGNESTATSTLTVNWNPVWLRAQDALAQLQPTQTPPITASTVGNSVHQTYSPRGPGDNISGMTPISFELDTAGNSYVFSRATVSTSSSTIFQRLGVGGWRRERLVTATPGANYFDPWTYTESWDGVTSSSIPPEQGYAICDFAAGSVDAAGNTYVVYNLDHTNGVTRTHYGILMVKFDSAGSMLWRRVLERPSSAGRLMPTPDGGAWLVLGNAYLQSIEYGFSMTEVMKVSPGGSFGPVAVHGQLDGGDYDPAVWATHLFSEVDSAGNLFLATSEDLIGGTGPIQVLRKHDASGAELAKLEVDPGETPEQWLSIKTDAIGNFYLMSQFTLSPTDQRVCVSRYNSSLQLQWRAFGPPNSMPCSAITAWNPQMHVGLAGITVCYASPGQGYYSEFPYEHGQITRFSTTGDMLWTRGIAGTQATVLAGDSIQNFEVDASGNVLFLAVFNEPINGGWFHYGKLTSAGDLQFIKAMGSLAEFFPQATTLYQGTQMLVLNLIGNGLPPPNDTYNLVLFDNPANQLVPVTLDLNHPADLLAVEGSAAQLRVINRGSAATYQWRKKDGLGVPQNIPGATLDRLFLNNIAPTDAGEYSVVVTNAVDAATSRTATVTVLAPVPLEIALDTPGRTWTTGGTRQWVGFGSTTLSHDNLDAAMPNNLGQGESSWLETTVTGPATVSFWWKSSNPSFSDFFDFSVDGDSVNHISRDQDWIFFQHTLGAGSHTLSWTLSKSSPSTAGTSNTVWLDQVIIANTTAVPLAEALDTTGLTWLTSAGGLAWTGVNSPSHDGVDSAASGTTGNNQQSYVETTVTGPGTLTFWWKVSCEPTFDRLAFTINGSSSGSIDGNADWQQQTRTIPAGPQTLRWSYNKDIFGIGGLDKAWLDQVVFTPGGVSAPDIAVESPVNHNLIDNSGTVDFGTALPGGSTVRTFTIRNTGTAPLSNIVISKSGGTSAALFTIGTLSSTDPILPGGTATFNVTFSPVVEGSRGAALLITSDDPDESPFDIGIYGTGGIPITTWRQQKFTPQQIAAGKDADDADADNDGVLNLLEFATSSDPNASNGEPGEMEPLDDSGFITFNYTRNKQAMAEVSYQVEWIDDLLLPPWSSVGVIETITGDTGLLQFVTAKVPAGTSGHRFVHLRVTRTP